MHFVTQVLLTITSLGYSLIPTIADFNATHATNPKWMPHARFHVVWQVMSFNCFALLALYLIWGSPPNLGVAPLWLAAALSVCAYAGFFCASFGKPIYGGAQFDVNGVQPFRVSFGGKSLLLDVNWSIFTVMAALLAAGVVTLANA
jgi:hypothetical protein